MAIQEAIGFLWFLWIATALRGLAMTTREFFKSLLEALRAAIVAERRA